MSTSLVDTITSGVAAARAAMAEAAREVIRLRTRCDRLQTALNRMVLAHEKLSADTEGQYPPLDAGCVECTGGATPQRFDTGLCALHNSKQLLGQL